MLGAALTLLLATPSPAFAHGADAPDATNYRTVITSAPQLAGVEIRTIEAGARLQLTNHSGRNVEVLGYQGEPYLEIRPDGVYENYHSPATYLNITITHVDPPAHADPTVPPVWQKVSDEPMHRWHDQRTIWIETTPPPAVAAAPDQPHHLRDWVVPMRVDATALQLTGTLDWVPPPAWWVWWLIAVGAVLVIALMGLLPKSRSITVVLALLAAVAGLLGLTYATSREVDAGNKTIGPILERALHHPIVDDRHGPRRDRGRRLRADPAQRGGRLRLGPWWRRGRALRGDGECRRLPSLDHPGAVGCGHWTDSHRHDHRARWWHRARRDASPSRHRSTR